MTAESAATASTMHVHVGLMKTASTTLQRHVFPHLPRVDYLNNGEQTSGIIRQITAAIVKEDDLRFDLDHCRELWSERPPTSDATGLISNEAFSIPVVDRRLKAQRLRDVFGDCKILIVVRHPLAMLTSHYGEAYKQSGYDRQAVGNINNWLAKKWSPVHATSVARNLEFSRVIATYRDIFEPGAVHVMFFEDLQQQPHMFAGQLARWLDADCASEIERRLIARANPRADRRQLYAARVSRYRLGAAAGRAVYRNMPARARKLIDRFLEKPLEIELDLEWRRTVMEFFRQENNGMADEEVSARMAELGYFM